MPYAFEEAGKAPLLEETAAAEEAGTGADGAIAALEYPEGAAVAAIVTVE